MAQHILLAYATKYGSTAEIAEAMAEAMRKKDVEVSVQPARQVRSLSDYQAVVLGAPLFMYKWHKDARRFLAKQRKALESMPVAVFAAGPSFNGDEKEWKEAREQFDKELAQFPWLKPVAKEMFGGKFDPTLLGFPFNKTLKDIPAADLRDWDAIAKWGEEIAKKLG